MGEHVAAAHQHLDSLITGLLVEVAGTGNLRTDVVPAELATYRLHALAAAGGMRFEEAARRFVVVTLAGLRAPH